MLFQKTNDFDTENVLVHEELGRPRE
jgi:hypothetical protein